MEHDPRLSATWAAAVCMGSASAMSINCRQVRCRRTLAINTDYLRPYKGFAVLRTTNNDANSIYNSLQINWNKRFTSGFGFGVAYTLSASNDDGSNQRDIIPNAYNAHNLWGPSEFDTRHVLVINYIYDLPIFRDHSKLTGKLLGGWQISGITQFQTGTPCGVGTADDFAGAGTIGRFWLRQRRPILGCERRS